MNDSLGTPLEVGDLVVSTSSTNGRTKFGRVEQGPYGLRMRITASFHYGKRESAEDPKRHPRRQAFGVNIIVLEKADGAIPEPLGEIYG